MAEITITKKIEELQQIFDRINKVFYVTTPNTAMVDLTTFDIELPVISDGVTFDMGSPDVTRVRLTTRQLWTSMAELGDPDISFQVSSVSEEISSMFMSKVGAVSQTSTVGGISFSGAGYDMTAKKVNGGLYLLSDDEKNAIFMPNVEMYGSLIVEQGSVPSYFNVQVTPLPSEEGQIIILKKVVTP